MKKSGGCILCLMWIVLLSLSIAIPAEATSDYVGSWQRAAKYVDGLLKSNSPATLVLTETSYSSITSAPPEEACAFTGSMTADNKVMRVTVNVSACPETIPTGEVQVYRFSVSDGGQTLTTTRSMSGKRIKQVYHREGTRGMAGTMEASCSHPLCGTWNRTATYVNGGLIHTTPAYTVITEKTYYSIAPACSNTLTIDSVRGNSFAMTMVSHNCPTGGRGIEPGTVVEQTFTLTDEGNTLTIINTEYGGEVKTVFQRLR